MTINYGTNNYNVAYNEIVNWALKRYNGLLDIVKPYINPRTFRSSYKIYIFDTRYQRDHIGAEAIQFNFKFARGVADIICHALVLTRRNISVDSDGNNMVDIVSQF